MKKTFTDKLTYFIKQLALFLWYSAGFTLALMLLISNSTSSPSLLGTSGGFDTPKIMLVLGVLSITMLPWFARPSRE